MEYPKIETLFARDEKTFKVIPGKLRLPEFELVKHWTITEKIDGTNVRVLLDTKPGYTDEHDVKFFGEPFVTYGGRTDAAQMPVRLLQYLQDTLPAAKVAAAFDPGTKALLFGEGYGPKIQSGGGKYRSTPGFRLFDVVVFGETGRPWWLNWADVEDVARKLEIETVPVLAVGIDLESAARFGRGVLSYVANVETSGPAGENIQAEGIVARTEPLLFDRRGQRVIWKLKARDF